MDTLAEITTTPKAPKAATEPEPKTKLTFKKSLIILCGLPGCGKTTLGKELVKHSNLVLLDVDQIRSSLFGHHPPDDQEREQREMKPSYQDAYLKAALELQLGHPIVLSAVYSDGLDHPDLKGLIEATKAPVKVFLLSLEDEQKVRERLAKRQQNGLEFSNIITYEDYLKVKARFKQNFKTTNGLEVIKINADPSAAAVYQQTLTHLKDLIIP